MKKLTLCCNSDFGKDDLEEERFYKLVFRLNSNVLQLCFSQSVDPDKLQAHHTIHNILTVLNSQHLGRLVPLVGLLIELICSKFG